jgi:hypothetical protein
MDAASTMAEMPHGVGREAFTCWHWKTSFPRGVPYVGQVPAGYSGQVRW